MVEEERVDVPWRAEVGRSALSAGPRPGGRRGAPTWSGPAVVESQPAGRPGIIWKTVVTSAGSPGELSGG